MADDRDDSSHRRPGGYSVRGGRAKDVEVFGRRRIVKRHTPRLRLDPELEAKLQEASPPPSPEPELPRSPVSSSPPASADDTRRLPAFGGAGVTSSPPPGSVPPSARRPPGAAPASPSDTRRLPAFGGAGIVGSAPPPPRPSTGPALTRRGPESSAHPRPSDHSQASTAKRVDDTVPVTIDEGPVGFDEDESGVLRKGLRPHTPIPRAAIPPTPPLGIELDPPDELAGVVHGEPPPPARRERATPSVGFRAPSSSRPPAPSRGDRRTPPLGHVPRVERVSVTGMSAVSSPPPRRRTNEEDPTRRAIRILETLRSCGPDDEAPAVEALKKVGLPALEPMEREFPGLLWFHRRVAHKRLPRGRDVGSLARAIVAFGESTVPMLRRLLENGDIDQRFYAVLIAGDVMPRCRETPRSQLLESLGRRLRDVDSQVSDVALHVLMAYRTDPAIHSMVGSFIVQMSDLSATPSDRVFAARVLGVLRCCQALSAFVERLDDPSPQVRDAARKALRLLTAEDLGSSRRKWASWARKHGGEHRVRWLIEGLIHRDEDLRTIALRELDKAGVKDFGYSPSMGRRDRKRIYRQALDWFAEEYG